MNSHVIEPYDIIFFDFDGVIKASNSAKGACFVSIFDDVDPRLASRILKHHESNAGLDRLSKIEIYLAWVNEQTDFASKGLKDYAYLFSCAVRKEVVNSAWVPGVQDFLMAMHRRKYLVVVSATPEKEMIEIVAELGLSRCFKEVYGYISGRTKTDVMIKVREAYYQQTSSIPHCIMFGDSVDDYRSANACKVDFIYVGADRPFDYKNRLPAEVPKIQNFNQIWRLQEMIRCTIRS